MSSRSILVAVVLSSLLACPAEAQVRDPLTTTFALRTVAFHSEQRIIVTTSSSGLFPVMALGWSCAWSKTQRELVVDCSPRDQDQGVTIRVGCSTETPSGDIAAMHLATHAEPDTATDVVASCYSK